MDVERLRRDFFYNLKRETDACFVCGRYAGKQTVIISFSSSQAVSVTVKRYSRNDNKVYRVIVGKQSSGGLLYAVGSGGKVARPGIDAKLQIVTCDNGQQYLFFRTPFPDEAVCIYFIRQ